MGGGLPLDSDCFEADMATVDIDESQFPVFDPVTGLPLSRPRGFNPPTRIVGGVEVPDPEIIDFPDTAYTRTFNGTSSACPVAAGVAALVFSISNTFTAEQVRNIVEHTADKITAPNEAFDPVTGHNERYGHGRVNALRAVEAAAAGKTWPSPVTGVQAVSSASTGMLIWTNPANDVAGVVIARSSTGSLDWSPTDEVEYQVGQQVAPGVVIITNSIVERLDQNLASLPAGQYEYGIFVRNAYNCYSWGRRGSFTTAALRPPLRLRSCRQQQLGRLPWPCTLPAGRSVRLSRTTWPTVGALATAMSPRIASRITATRRRRVLCPAHGDQHQGESGYSVVRIVVTAPYNHPPQVSVQANPTSGQAPLPVLFQATGTDTDGQVVRYEWNFADGSPVVTGQVVQHVFLDPGIYAVQVKAVDDQGGTGKNGPSITVTVASTTAAETDPEDLLNGSPLCAAGLGPAILAAATGLLMLRLVRRKR
jgi:hypothetical protein